MCNTVRHEVCVWVDGGVEVAAEWLAAEEADVGGGGAFSGAARSAHEGARAVVSGHEPSTGSQRVFADDLC